MIIDTHSHLYLEQFDEDRVSVIKRAIDEGVEAVILPNIDRGSVNDLRNLYIEDKSFFKCALGLHPTSVKKDFQKEIDFILNQDIPIIGIGEIGIDLYWDKTYIKEQKIAFDYQLTIAVERNLPVIIHSRNSFDEVIEVLKPHVNNGIKGVFHCFPGDYKQAELVVDMGLYIGIGGVLTYKKSDLPELIAKLPLEHIVLETDAPYLSPVPKRGKRNEPSYLKYVISQISEITNVPYNDVCSITTTNAKKLFKI